jgi:hypothetical protein
MSVADLFDRLDRRVADLPPQVGKIAAPALTRLREAAPSLDRLGERAIRDALSLFTMNPSSLHDLLEVAAAAFEERRQIFLEASADAWQARRQRKADAKAVADALLDAGEGALKAAIPIILSVV